MSKESKIKVVLAVDNLTAEVPRNATRKQIKEQNQHLTDVQVDRVFNLTRELKDEDPMNDYIK